MRSSWVTFANLTGLNNPIFVLLAIKAFYSKNLNKNKMCSTFTVIPINTVVYKRNTGVLSGMVSNLSKKIYI